MIFRYKYTRFTVRLKPLSYKSYREKLFVFAPIITNYYDL